MNNRMVLWSAAGSVRTSAELGLRLDQFEIRFDQLKLLLDHPQLLLNQLALRLDQLEENRRLTDGVC